jgi:hypothetical protein
MNPIVVRLQDASRVSLEVIVILQVIVERPLLAK